MTRKQQQPKKFDFYLVNDDSLERLKILASECCHSIEDEEEVEDIMEEIRSRPHPAPQAQDEYVLNFPNREYAKRMIAEHDAAIARPHPAPQAPDEHYTGTCAMQEKCNDYADFCESIMDEITENEDEDPPCPIKCAKRVNPHQADCTEAARKAREDEREKMLEDICQNCGGLADGGEQCKTCYVKSLRHHSEQQEQPR